MEDVMLDKVAKLLNKAERASTQEEADAFFAKATELMQKYALSEMMVQARRSGAQQEPIIEKTVKFTGSYAKAHLLLGHYVGQASKCRTVQSSGSKSTEILYLVGFESDVSRAETLIASLLIQAQRGVQRFGRTIPEYYTPFEKFRERRSYLVGFAEAVSDRMVKSERAATKEYVSERVAAGEDEQALNTSMSLAIRSRRDEVNDWMDNRFGRLRSARSRMSVGYGGAAAGRADGAKADTGGPRMGPGGARQLGR